MYCCHNSVSSWRARIEGPVSWVTHLMNVSKWISLRARLRTCVMGNSSHECLRIYLLINTVSQWHTFVWHTFVIVIVICMILQKGVCRVSKLVNNTWPVDMIQKWEWEVGAHVPPNILVVCHTVKCTFILAICSLHPCDTSYILSWFSTCSRFLF